MNDFISSSTLVKGDGLIGREIRGPDAVRHQSHYYAGAGRSLSRARIVVVEKNGNNWCI